MRKRNRQPTLRSVKMFRLRAGCRKPNIGGFSVLPIRLRHIRPRLRDGFRWKSEPSLCTQRESEQKPDSEADQPPRQDTQRAAKHALTRVSRCQKDFLGWIPPTASVAAVPRNAFESWFEAHPSVKELGKDHANCLSWSRLIGQFGGLAKLGSGCRHAASFIVPVALYASSGVRPASVECGRRVL
jgi:hypothetical protein